MPGQSDPPSVTQITEYLDEQGRRVRVFSPGWAEGGEPSAARWKLPPAEMED